MISVASQGASQHSHSPQQRWLEITLIVVVFFATAGVPVPNVNETHYLTKAKHYWQPDWCPGDLFLESADAHLTFYWTVGYLTKWWSLPIVAWTGRFVAWFALAWSWQRLSAKVVPMRWCSVVTAILLVTLIEHGNFAGEWVVGGVEAKCFAYFFVFWGLSELAAGKWMHVWPLFGLASAFHVLVGGWSVVCAGAVWLLEPRGSRPTLWKMLPSLLAGGLLALPGIVPGYLLTTGVPADVSEQANQIYVFERLPHHLAIHRLPRPEIITRFTRFGLLLVAFAALWRWNSEHNRAQTKCELQRVHLFAFASVLICILGLGWELATVAYPALSASLLKYYWYRTADVAVPVAISLTMGGFIAAANMRPSRLSMGLAALAVLIPGSLLLLTARERWQVQTPLETRTTREALGWRDVCRWARENTPPNSLFLIPRHAATFRWYAERPTFFAWKDIPQDAASQVAWWRRYQDVYFGAIDEFGELVPYGSLQELGPERLREVAAEHNIDYILTSEYPPLPLNVAYENAWYKLYDVRPTNNDN